MIHKKYVTTDFVRSRNSGPLRPGANDYAAVVSRDSTVTGSCSRVESPRYTGQNLIGIATMHKSNAIPISRDSDMAVAISKMRRG